MKTFTKRAVDAFARAGVLCAEHDVLPDALRELAIRLDLAGVNDLVELLIRTDWSPDDE